MQGGMFSWVADFLFSEVSVSSETLFMLFAAVVRIASWLDRSEKLCSVAAGVSLGFR